MDEDGDKDALRIDINGGFSEAMSLFFAERTGTWPFEIVDGFNDEQIYTRPSNAQVPSWGVNFIDIDLDGIDDIVGGTERNNFV